MTTDRLALPRRYRDQLEALLREHVPGVEVWAYGSRVNGESHDGSDLDPSACAVLPWKPLDGGFYDLLEAIEKSNVPILVQAHDWAMLPESFHREIAQDYVVVQKGAKQTTAGEWPVVTISDIAEKVAMGPFGSSIKVETFVPEGVPVISGQHLHGFRVDDTPGFNFISHEHAQRLANANVMRGDIVLTHRGTIGQVACIPEHSQFDRYVVSQSQFYMRCDRSKAIPEFVTMYFKSHEGQHQLLANASQVGVPSIAQPVTYLRTIEIPLPPMPQQRAIAHVLGTLDDKIELNRRMNETLEAMARALFKSWFVDFEPVRAKREGRWRPGESLPGLAADLYELFPDRLVDSQLGEVPEGWEVKALGEVVDLNPSEPMKRGTLAPYLDMAALPTSGSSTDTAVLREFKSGTRFRNGDTLLARITPCLENGKTAFVQSLQDGEVGWGSTEFIVMRAMPPVPPEYPYLLGRDVDFREHAIQSMTGTSGRQRVQVDALAPYPLSSPSAETWNEFSALVSPLFAQVEFNRKESLALVAQRDTLLPRLVSGEVGVENHNVTPQDAAR